MEKEVFLSGYCRVLDSSRTVCVLLEDGRFQEADCHYGSCPYASSCPIAKEIDKEPSFH